MGLDGLTLKILHLDYNVQEKKYNGPSLHTFVTGYRIVNPFY